MYQVSTDLCMKYPVLVYFQNKDRVLGPFNVIPIEIALQFKKGELHQLEIRKNVVQLPC